MSGGGTSDDTVPAGDRVHPPDPRLGTVIDKYTIVRLLGRGGMGAVYEARHTVLARRAALKFLLPQSAEHPELLKRFENEAKAAGRLEHPNIAAVTDFGRAPDGAPYLVMEYLEGEDCAHLLGRYGRLSVPRAVDIVRQACRGLAVAHRAGIVHRDLKPENLFIARGGDGGDWVKVLDFGIAKLIAFEGGVPTRTGAALGTAYYMSPEQARGATDVDLRTDVWSLGVVLYQLLSGQRPFQGEQFLHIIHRILSFDPTPLGTLQPDLPPALLDVVARSMSKDVDARLPSAEALEAALAPFSERTPSQLEPAPVREHPARTEITPATSVDGVSVGHTGARPLPGLEPRSGGTGQRRPAGLIVVAAVAAVLAGWLGWRGLRPPAESTGSALPASTAPPVAAAVTSVPGVDTSLAASPSPTTAPLPPASASASAAASVEPPPRSSPRAGEPGLAARPASAVRSLSEHSRLSSNTSDSRPSATGVIVPTPAEPASAAPAPPVLRGSSAQKRTIDIEEGNPYE